MKRNVIAALIFLPVLLVSCAGGENPSGGSSVSETKSETAAETTAVTLSEREILFSDLPTGKYGGYTFRIFSYGEVGNNSFVVEEMDGEILHDTVFSRNRELEDALEVKFAYTYDTTGNVVSKVGKAVLAGEDSWDVANAQAMGIGPKVTTGMCLNLHDIKAINVEKPWWDGKTAAEYEIGGKLYFSHAILDTTGLGTVWSIYFNNKLIKDNKLGSIYDLVNGGGWTFAKLREYGLAVSKDLNGDGAIALSDDVVGMMTNKSFYLTLLHGAGEALITKDKAGLPVFEKPDARFTKVYDAIVEYAMKSNSFHNYNTYNITDNNIRFGLFAADKVLFSGMMVDSGKFLRDMENDFGILPIPKFDDSQEEYFSYQGPSAGALFVPASSADPERVGTILENLCAWSHYDLRSAYFETTLQDKIFRDAESVKMLDILYDNLTAELGYVYGFNKVYDVYMNAVAAEAGIASTFESVYDATNAAITKFVGEM